MAKRKNSSAALARNDFPADLPPKPKASPVREVAQPTLAADDPVEAMFFERGDRGLVEPPIYLPREPMLLPIVGIVFLAGLTALVLL